MHADYRDQIVGILLAAGKGSRFDVSGTKNKLLQTAGTGDKVVVAAATALLSSLPSVTAVVRNADDAVAIELLRLGCHIAVCPDADQGMGTSLAYALQQTLDAFGWVIALGDMPYVQAATITALADAVRDGADIAAPVYQNRRGNPVAFGKTHLPELLRLHGDRGARGLLQNFPATVVTVNDPGIHRDVDTPADLTN